MNLTLTLPALLYLTGTVLGLIVSLICWFYPRNQRSCIQFLGFSVFSLTWTLFIFFLHESKLIIYLPHLYQTNFIATLLYLPFSFFFVRGAMHEDQCQLIRLDLIHILPVLIFLADYSSIYLLSASEKLALFENESLSPFDFRDGNFFSRHVHKPSRFILFLIYSGLQFLLVAHLEHALKKWITPYLVAQFSLILYYVVTQFSLSNEASSTINLVITLYLLFTCISLLSNPKLLYNNAADLLQVATVAQMKEEVAYDPIKEKADIIAKRLEDYMVSDSPFLRHGYTIHNLSSDLHIPPHQLSLYLNHYLRLSFNDYMNKHRVEHSKKLMRNGVGQLYTLEALGHQCGFNNRNSFTSAFKRFTGMTPSEYIRSARKDGFAKDL